MRAERNRPLPVVPLTCEVRIDVKQLVEALEEDDVVSIVDGLVKRFGAPVVLAPFSDLDLASDRPNKLELL